MSQLKKVFEEADEKYRLLTKIPEEFLSAPQEFRKRSEKLITTYKTECSVSENKHNESLAACLDTREKKIKEINNDTKEKIRDLRDKRDKDLKISRKNVVKKLTKQQDLVFSLGVMILAIILGLAGMVWLGFLIADSKNPERAVIKKKIAKAEENYKSWSNHGYDNPKKVKELENKIKNLKSMLFDKGEIFSIFVRKGGIQLVITIILSSGLIFIYIRKILLFNSHKKMIKSYSVDSSDHDNTSQAIKIDPDEDTDADAYYQEIAFKRRMKESSTKVDSDKTPITASTTSPPPTPTSDSLTSVSIPKGDQEDMGNPFEIDACKQAVKINPDDAVAHADLGAAYHFSGKHKEAIESLKQAIGIDPDLEKAHACLGWAYDKLDMYKEAMESYKHAIRINPDNAAVHFSLGTDYAKSGEYKEAIEPFKQAIKIEPDAYASLAHYNLGLVYHFSYDRDSALEQYNILKSLDPEKAKELTNLIHK